MVLAQLINYIDQIFSQFNKLETQECCLLRKLNMNLLFKVEEIFSNKLGKEVYKDMPPLTKIYFEFS